MSLNKYGVLVGRFDHFERDDPVRYGNFYHGQIFIAAPPPSGSGTVIYRCAVDVKMPNGIVEYLKLNLKRPDIATILALADGYHELLRNSDSGALDYVRSPFIKGPLGCLAVFYGLLKIFFGVAKGPWIQNAGGSVLTDLESILQNVKRVYVFGEPFTNQNPVAYGMHDVHMNQGDPMPAAGDPEYQQKLKWYNNSGIWQDGAVLVEHTDDSVQGFFIKFLTQTLNTGNDGHPL